MPLLLQTEDDLVELPKIGEGYFSHAYRYGDTVYVKSVCPMKAMLVGLDHPNLPRVELVDTGLYKMPFYNGANKWTYDEVEHWSDVYYECLKASNYDYFDASCLFVERIQSQVSPLLHEAFTILLDKLTTYNDENYGQPFFDFKAENVSIDHLGNIILRDMIADGEGTEYTPFDTKVLSDLPEVSPDQLSLPLDW